VIADTVIPDAIFDRLQHSALTIEVTGESYRGPDGARRCF
jgi:hypothetical protein